MEIDPATASSTTASSTTASSTTASSTTASTTASSTTKTDFKSNFKSGDFRLSTSLVGHSYAVRDIAVVDDDLIVTAEERGVMNVWERVSETGKIFAKRDIPALYHPVHEGLVFCLEYLNSSLASTKKQEEKDAMDVIDEKLRGGLLWSGGGDNSARSFTVDGQLGKSLRAGDLKSPICSIARTKDGALITGCWDGKARIWYQKGDGEWEVKSTLAGHEHAVEVLVLPTGEIVTGSADKSICIWNNDKVVKKIPKAHDHTIRKLLVHPLGFASAANDGAVKIWSQKGDMLVRIAAIAADTDSAKFIYGLAVLLSGELVSCGEDGVVRVWSTDGALKQSIPHPGSVRCVKALPNGDIVTGCSDRTARIFTRNSNRFASEKELEEFESMIQLIQASGMTAMDLSTLATEQALLEPGSKDGQVKVINVKNRGAIVYKWVSKLMKWEEVGEAIGKAQKKVHEGKEYDFVTDVFITDEIKAKLGFNKDEDPMDIATRFCTQNGVPFDYRDQIIAHVKPLVDPVLIQQKKIRDKMAADQSALYHVPAWRTGGYHLYTESKVKAMKGKLLEYSEAFKKEGKENFSLSEDEVKCLDELLNNVEDVKNFHKNPFPPNQYKLMSKLLAWPSKQLLPVLDILRVLMCHDAAVTSFSSGDQPVIRRVNEILSSHTESKTHVSLILKIYTNWIAKRPKPDSEKAQPPKIAPALLDQLTNVLDQVANCASGDDGVALSYVLLLNNFVQWLGRMKMGECDLFALIISGLGELLKSKRKEKTLFYSLLVIGSICYASESAKSLVEDTMGEQLREILTSAKTSSNQAIVQVAQDVTRVLS